MTYLRKAALALALSLMPVAALAQDYTIGSIKISQVWSREVPGGARVAGGFMTITNTGMELDTLVGGTAAIAGAFEVHEMSMTDGIMKMRRLQPGLEIRPGETVALKPGSYHVMLMNLKEAPKVGKTIKGTLVFQKAGAIEIEYKVAPFGTRVPGDGGTPLPKKAGTPHHGKH